MNLSGQNTYHFLKIFLLCGIKRLVILCHEISYRIIQFLACSITCVSNDQLVYFLVANSVYISGWLSCRWVNQLVVFDFFTETVLWQWQQIGFLISAESGSPSLLLLSQKCAQTLLVVWGFVTNTYSSCKLSSHSSLTSYNFNSLSAGLQYCDIK